MKTKKGFVLRSLGREHILVAEGLDADADKMVSLNESAAFLWQSVEGKEFDAETMIHLLMEEYGITREVAEKDVMPLLQIWKEAGIIAD